MSVVLRSFSLAVRRVGAVGGAAALVAAMAAVEPALPDPVGSGGATSAAAGSVSHSVVSAEAAMLLGEDQVDLAASRAGSVKRLSRGERVVRAAARQAGDPYRWGAAGPSAFDCSGLTMFAYRQATGKRLPHSSREQRKVTKRVSMRAAKRGDLVFFHGSSGVYHVAIYAGRNRVWHAPGTGERVHKAKIWSHRVTFGRVRP